MPSHIRRTGHIHARYCPLLLTKERCDGVCGSLCECVDQRSEREHRWRDEEAGIEDPYDVEVLDRLRKEHLIRKEVEHLIRR